MKFSISVEDRLFEKYVQRWGIPGCYQAMRRAIDTFKDVEKSDRYLFVSGDERREIEAIFQTTMDDAKKLATHVKNLSQFKINGVEINFTTDELARLSAQAGFHGRSLDQFIREMATEIKDRMLETV